MKQADIIALKRTLFNLPFDLQQYLVNQLVKQLHTHTDTLLETARPRLQCPH